MGNARVREKDFKLHTWFATMPACAGLIGATRIPARLSAACSHQSPCTPGSSRGRRAGNLFGGIFVPLS